MVPAFFPRLVAKSCARRVSDTAPVVINPGYLV